jgi:hypothetical protein
MKELDPSIRRLLDQVCALEKEYPYSSLLINIPESPKTEQLFHDLCERAILDDTGQERYWMHEAIKDKKGLLSCFLGYIYTAADKLRETKDLHWLHVGLGASILQDGYPDRRDYLLAMAELYITAEEAGLDPRPAFELIGYKNGSDFGDLAVVKSQRADRHWS